jgi:hypothetical protein
MLYPERTVVLPTGSGNGCLLAGCCPIAFITGQSGQLVAVTPATYNFLYVRMAAARRAAEP